MGILEDLFDGKVIPYENLAPKSPEYDTLTHKIDAEKEYFKSRLSEEDYKRLERLESLYNDTLTAHENMTFKCGFQLGVKLIVEVYYNGGKLPDLLEFLKADERVNNGK